MLIITFLIFQKIHKTVDKHWCYGESNQKFGNFPLRHLHKVELPETNENESIFISIAPFHGEQPGDLAFDQGMVDVTTFERIFLEIKIFIKSNC